MDNAAKDALGILIRDHKAVKALFAQFEAQSDKSTVSKKRIADQICDALVTHTKVEEEIFYPAVRVAIKNHDLMDEALVEHACAKTLITEIHSMDPDDDLYDARIRVLSEQIEHHVREEEDEMFPKVRKAHLDLVALGHTMRARKKQLEATALAA